MSKSQTPQPIRGMQSLLGEEADRMHAVVEAFDRLSDAGEAVGTLDGRVVDKYERAAAERTLEWAAACAAKDAYKARALAAAQAADPA